MGQSPPAAIRVLHVDDSPDFAEMTAEFLARETDRLVVETATSASEGLERLAERRVDCVVSDYDMPGRNGIEFLEAVRAEYPNLPFILYTGKGSEEVASEAISAGVTDYLQKGSGTGQYTVLANRIENAVDQYRAEREAEQSQRRLREVAESTTDCLWMFDADWEEMLFVSGYEEVWGRPVDALEENPRDFLDGVDPDDRETVERAMQRLSDGEEIDVEFRIHPGEDDPRWLWAEGTPIVDGEGRVVRVVGFVRDVTDRKERERQLEAIIGNADAAIYIKNRDGEYQLANEALGDIFGMDAGEIPGKHVTDVFDEDSAERSLRADRRVMASGEPETEEVVRTVDGERRVFLSNKFPYRDADGSIVGVIGVSRDITERTEREAELQRRTRAMDEAPIGITICDPACDGGSQVYANERFEELAGSEGAVDLPFPCLGEAELDPDSAAAVREALDAEEPMTVQVQRGGETESWSRVSLAPVRDETGTVTNWVAFEEDVTDHKERERAIEALHGTARSFMRAERVEEAARVAVEAVRDIFDMPATAVHLYDEDGDCLPPVAWTDETEALVGKPPTLQRGGSIAWDVFETGEAQVHDDVSKVTDRYNPETDVRSEMTFPLGDHGVLIVGSGEPAAFDETDVSLVRMLVSHLEAVLDRIERERDLKRYRSMVNAMHEAACIYDENGRFEVVNEYLAEWYGTDIASLEGKESNLVPYVRTQSDGDPFRELLDGERDEVRMEVEREFDTQGHAVLDYRLTPLRIDGERRTVVGVAREITERKEREKTLERQNERLEEFASIVSHDLRNPLNVAQGRLELADDECDSEHLRHVGNALDRIGALIDDLLTLAREGERVSDVGAVTLADTVDGCWGNVETAEATLVNDAEGTILADRSRLQQLLENLFRNSVEHGSNQPGTDDTADRAGEGVRITVGTLDDGPGFYVADDGPGIPESDRERVFESGFSTSTDGTGFGLAIVREIAEAHGWDVAVRDSDDGGARFEITGVQPVPVQEQEQ